MTAVHTAPTVDRATAVRLWMRRNLFRTPFDAVCTVVFGSVAVYLSFRLLRFVLATARWQIIRVNLKIIMVGRFPDDELWRASVALIVLAAWAGLLAGLLRTRASRLRAASGRQQSLGRRAAELVRRVAVPLLMVVVVLSLTRSVGPTLSVLAALAAAVGGSLLGRPIARGAARLPMPVRALGVVLLGALPIALTWWLASAVGWEQWGGFLINLFVAITAIVLCFPLGVLLALGRRSKLPLLRLVCTVYIEVFRGAPLFVLLLMANVALEFFVPTVWDPPGTVVRAIIVFTLFTAAYLAEIVRGGLQSVGRGQEEAAKALGLSPPRMTFFIVLPQALRNVIPAQIGQFISLFKDTTLAGAAMGLFELGEVATSTTSQPAFVGLGLIIEALTFVAFLFWVVSYTMSRESQRLERRLGVGTR